MSFIKYLQEALTNEADVTLELEPIENPYINECKAILEYANKNNIYLQKLNLEDVIKKNPTLNINKLTIAYEIMKELIGFEDAKIEDYLSFVDDLGELDNINLKVWIDSDDIEDYEIYSGDVKLNKNDLVKYKQQIENQLDKALQKYNEDYEKKQAASKAEYQSDARESRRERDLNRY